MRRVLSILLALAFGFGPVPLAIGFHDDASLPACCRRQGAHHCAMAAQSRSASQGTDAFAAPRHCPLFPADQNVAPSSVAALVRWPFAAPLSVQIAPSGAEILFANGAENLCTFSLRGPPTHFSA